MRLDAKTFIWLFACLLFVSSTRAQDLKWKVERADDWTETFKRTEGWFGADGIFSIPLDANDSNSGDERTFIYFSDSFIGTVTNGAPEPGYTMVNNTVAYFDGVDLKNEEVQIHYNTDDQGTPVSYFVPDNENAVEGQHYWLGDGFLNAEKDNTIYIFAYHVEWTGENVFDFKEYGASLLAFPATDEPPFPNQRQMTTPLHVNHPEYGEGNFGSGIFVNTEWAGARAIRDGYVYVYGSMRGTGQKCHGLQSQTKGLRSIQ